MSDEIKPQQNRRHAITLFHPPFQSAQRAGFDLDPHPRTDVWRKSNFQVRFQGLKDLTKLADELRLVVNRQQICHMVALKNRLPLFRQQMNENIAGKQRLFENNFLATIFADTLIARERHFKTPPFTKLLELLFPPWERMGHEP